MISDCSRIQTLSRILLAGMKERVVWVSGVAWMRSISGAPCRWAGMAQALEELAVADATASVPIIRDPTLNNFVHHAAILHVIADFIRNTRWFVLSLRYDPEVKAARAVSSSTPQASGSWALHASK